MTARSMRIRVGTSDEDPPRSGQDRDSGVDERHPKVTRVASEPIRSVRHDGRCSSVGIDRSAGAPERGDEGRRECTAREDQEHAEPLFQCVWKRREGQQPLGRTRAPGPLRRSTWRRDDSGRKASVTRGAAGGSATAEQMGAAVPAVITPVLAVITPVLASVATVIAAIRASFATPPEERSRSISSIPEKSHLTFLSESARSALTISVRRTSPGRQAQPGEPRNPLSSSPR